MQEKSISVKDALRLIKNGKEIKGQDVDFGGSQIKASDAYLLSMAGVKVPENLIVYDDLDVVHDPQFDNYSWERTDYDPFQSLKDKLTVNIEIENEIRIWLQKNDIELGKLMGKLIKDFYSSNQLLKGK